MWDFVLFLKNALLRLAAVFDQFSFNLGGINFTLLEIFLGLIAFAMVVSVFWKGARG